MDNWLESLLWEWGAAKRRVLGIPAQPSSVFGRFLATEGGPAAAASRGERPDDPEVMLNNGLLVARAIRTALDEHVLTWHQHEILTAHYVYWGPPRVKAKRMRIPQAKYFSRLDSARATIAPYVTRFAGSDC